MSTFNKLYRQTLGNPWLRSVVIGALYGDYERAKKSGKSGYVKAVSAQLWSLGEGDYMEADHGESPKYS